MGLLMHKVLGLPPQEATFARRGFPPASQRARARLETTGLTFLEGYNAALRIDDTDRLTAALEATPRDYRGFAYEGAAMALTLRDFLAPWGRSRFQSLLDGAGARHKYMLHVGAGWALARLPLPAGRYLRRADPLLGWLALDGFGFHQGYFHWKESIAAGRRPRRLSGYALRAFDQGLGRSLWFVSGADLERVQAYLAGMAPDRLPDLWAGVGLACTYAGGVDAATVGHLIRMAGEYRAQCAQGAAFAATARLLAGLVTPESEQTCNLICGRTSAEAAAIADEALRDLPGTGTGPVPAYETWRVRIQTKLSEVTVS